MATTPRPDAAPVRQPTLGPVGWLRFLWRQLTSMRTALFLLLILAVAAVPGSVFPQRSIDATRTTDWIADRPTIGPWLDRLGFFDVYATPWFASIYLLLFVSLVGCVLPRAKLHWAAMRQPPPRTPVRLERLPAHLRVEVADDGAATLDALETTLRRRRYKVHRHAPGTLSAEGGYVKETGNLLFHLALIGIIVGVAVGHLWGWKGDAIVPVGQTFAKTRFDTFAPGPWVSDDDVPPFTLRVNDFHAEFEREVTGRGQFGMPRDFTAFVTATEDGTSRDDIIQVNRPLELDGATVFLLGNGYAPVITVRDAAGEVLYSGSTPFLPQDNNYQSVGAIKVPAADPGLGFVGWFLPTAVIDEDAGPQSVFPDALQPAFALSVYEGELFPDGRPQSVFRLNTDEMTQLTNVEGTDAARIWLELGDTVQLPGERGSITFESVERFAGISVRYDPGRWLTLVSALLALGGLVITLIVPRRRIFARVGDSGPEGRTVVTVAAMAKADDTGLDSLLTDLVEDLADDQGTNEKDDR
ncbi:MAG TPA: cytochrome c biogenesis protein ResB [Intrasporangiaceae bacterium]|nr:cytochrome c biogenesis protein ResB [Intrasporangiaceae bacterium]